MPIDFTGIKTTGNRKYEEEFIAQINDSLQDIPIKQRAAILGSIIEESGGDPLARSKNNTYQGLLQLKSRNSFLLYLFGLIGMAPPENMKKHLDCCVVGSTSTDSLIWLLSESVPLKKYFGLSRYFPLPFFMRNPFSVIIWKPSLTCSGMFADIVRDSFLLAQEPSATGSEAVCDISSEYPWRMFNVHGKSLAKNGATYTEKVLLKTEQHLTKLR